MSDTAPDFVPTTKVFETTKTFFEAFGTSADVVNKLVAQGWVVEEETTSGTSLSHPLIPGTARFIQTQ